MRRGGRPAQGGTPATVGPRWPVHWQARPPLVGGLPPCAGLALALPAGATAGTPARRRRSPAPRRARSAGKAALAPPLRAAVQIAGPRRGKAAGRRARPGLAAGSGEGRGPATPGGECAGRAERHGLRRRRGRAGEAGRSAADRAGGADGPTAPTLWGPGRAGAPTPQPARGRSKARPAAGGLPWPCFAEGCPRATAGGQLGRDAPQARPWPPHYPARPAGP